MKSKILFIPILVFLLSNSNPCLSQSDTVIVSMPDCCPGENRDEYLQVFYPENDCSVCALIDGLSEIVELFSNILIESSSGLVENNNEWYSTSKTNVSSEIGDKMEMELASTYESFVDSADNSAYSINDFLSMTFKIDNDHTFRLHSESIELHSSKDDKQTSNKMNYWIRKNDKQIFFNYSINEVVSSAKFNNEKEVNQLFEQLIVYLKNLGCDVEIQSIEITRSGKTEIVNHVCLCAEKAKFIENVKLKE